MMVIPVRISRCLASLLAASALSVPPVHATPAKPAKAATAPAAAAPALPDEHRTAMLRALRDLPERVFKLDTALDAELDLDPALRTEAAALASAHVARVDGLLNAWLDEELAVMQAAGGRMRLDRLFNAVMARLINEFAAWQIEPGDAGYEQATLDVLRTAAPPAVCRNVGDLRSNDYVDRIVRIQAMPAAQRQAALAAERTLLGHWGKPRAALPEWPDPLPQDAAMAWLQPVRPAAASSDARRSGVALPPILASELLGLRKTYRALDRPQQCAVQQWWLRESLRQGTAPAAALAAFRYGTLVLPAFRFGGVPQIVGPEQKYDPAVPRPPYPKLAAYFGVNGTTRVRVQTDAAGKPLQAAVERRDIRVDGIRGVRPVAFENVFDDILLQYAMAGTFDQGKGGKPFRYDYVWKLDDTPVTQPDGGKR